MSERARRVCTADLRWQAFLAETAGDEWWAAEEAALRTLEHGAPPPRIAADGTAGRPPMLVSIVPGLVHLSSLPAGWRVIVADQEYTPKPLARPTLRQRVGRRLTAWLARQWAKA